MKTDAFKQWDLTRIETIKQAAESKSKRGSTNKTQHLAVCCLSALQSVIHDDEARIIWRCLFALLATTSSSCSFASYSWRRIWSILLRSYRTAWGLAYKFERQSQPKGHRRWDRSANWWWRAALSVWSVPATNFLSVCRGRWRRYPLCCNDRSWFWTSRLVAWSGSCSESWCVNERCRPQMESPLGLRCTPPIRICFCLLTVRPRRVLAPWSIALTHDAVASLAWPAWQW